MAGTTAQPRQLSRPGSASTSSPVTVQRAASMSSRSTSRPRGPLLRSPSPPDLASTISDQPLRTISPDPNPRTSAVYPRPDSSNGVKGGMGNLNRWSQSTASNRSSLNNRRNSLSKRLSTSLGVTGTNKGTSHSSATPSTKITNGKSSQSNSPQKYQHSSLAPPPVLPPISTLTSLSQAVDETDTPSSVMTVTPATAALLSSSNAIGSDQDYFGKTWNTREMPSHGSRLSRSPAGMAASSTDQSPRRGLTSSYNSSAARSTRRTSALQRDPNSSELPGNENRNNSRERRQSRKRHSRNRAEESTKSSTGTEGESSASSSRRSHRRDSRRGTPSQKAMLSKALAKAKHAVLLDNAQNFEGAMSAYGDACALLQQVMNRSSGEDDRKKLEAVRHTYTTRINELRNTDQSYQSADGKALPSRPPQRNSKEEEPLSPLTDEEDEEYFTGTTSGARLQGDGVYKPVTGTYVQPPPRRQSLQPSLYIRETQQAAGILPEAHQVYQPAGFRGQNYSQMPTLRIPLYQEDMPPPLSPSRSLSPAPPPKDDISPSGAASELGGPWDRGGHVRHDTTESTSWLNTIDESGNSDSSSLHSRSSAGRQRRRHIRAGSGDTEAEFGAALDAAIETAYDDGYEPAEENEDEASEDENHQSAEKDFLSNVRRKVELAKEKTREIEREAALAAAKEREKRRLEQNSHHRNSLDFDYDDDEAEEEERMLDEMTREYVLDDNDYDAQTKSALPRQSDSSGFSGRTWGSSIGSNPTSAATSLSTVAETSMLPSLVSQMQGKVLPPPLHPPPAGALPQPPSGASATSKARTASGVAGRPSSLITSPGVRERRLSGMKMKQLKIDTNSHIAPPLASAPPKPNNVAMAPSIAIDLHAGPKSALPFTDTDRSLPSLVLKPSASSLASGRKGSSPLPTPGSGEAQISAIPHTPGGLTKVTSAESFDSAHSVPDSPGRASGKGSINSRLLKKNFSSSSLKNKVFGGSMNEPIDGTDAVPTVNAVPEPKLPMQATPTEISFADDTSAQGGIYLFDSDIHSPCDPGTPNPVLANAPVALEPCPESSLLRPFWFLRCIYQTLAHPRGGYITARLFVPRDIWRVKNVKLKSVDEKVSSCDILTASLLKLAQVDTYDADAILQEMQFLDNIMEQTQSNLSKKLGTEVGLVGAPSLFKDSKATEDQAVNNDSISLKSINAGGKSYFSSLKKLRSKSSGGSTQSTNTNPSKSKEETQQAYPNKSIPMTDAVNPRFPKRDPTQVQASGPHAHYMGALAKLCDAVQILDQIARQVEDPGLRRSSPTHVGLELSTRHAAEFFGFYVCRFVINDVGMMLDKFIKRGSEWVMA